MSTLRTQPNGLDPVEFIREINSAQMLSDAMHLLELMKDLTGEQPIMWGSSIIGFGSYHYKYDSGREGDWFLTGFSPRKKNLSIYIMAGFDRYQELIRDLGKYKTGASCLYVNKLEDIELTVLRELIRSSVDYLRQKYG